MKRPCVYILANRPYGTLYVGVTSDLEARVSIHKQALVDGFTRRYGIHRLVYYEFLETMEDAIRREKRSKRWSRAWKLRQINRMNPEWNDLFDEFWGTLCNGPADDERLRIVRAHRGSPPARG